MKTFVSTSIPNTIMIVSSRSLKSLRGMPSRFVNQMYALAFARILNGVATFAEKIAIKSSR